MCLCLVKRVFSGAIRDSREDVLVSGEERRFGIKHYKNRNTSTLLEGRRQQACVFVSTRVLDSRFTVSRSVE